MDCDEVSKTTPMDLREVNRFMNREAPQIHESYGGLSVNEDGHLIIPDHYKLGITVCHNSTENRMLTLLSRKLQPAIQSYLKNAGTFNHKTTREEWEALYDDIATAEAKASDSDNGPLEIFNKMILKIGENSDSVDPWIHLIPNSYGLCVVKSGFALLLSVCTRLCSEWWVEANIHRWQRLIQRQDRQYSMLSLLFGTLLAPLPREACPSNLIPVSIESQESYTAL
jgi:hypothetical protein